MGWKEGSFVGVRSLGFARDRSAKQKIRMTRPSAPVIHGINSWVSGYVKECNCGPIKVSRGDAADLAQGVKHAEY